MQQVARACRSVRDAKPATAYGMRMRLCLCIGVLISFGWSCCAGEGLRQLQGDCAKHICKKWSVKGCNKEDDSSIMGANSLTSGWLASVAGMHHEGVHMACIEAKASSLPLVALGLRPGFLLATTGALSASRSALDFFIGLRWRFLMGRGRSMTAGMACGAWSTGISWATSSGRSSIPVICVAVLLLLPLVGDVSKPEKMIRTC